MKHHPDHISKQLCGRGLPEKGMLRHGYLFLHIRISRITLIYQLGIAHHRTGAAWNGAIRKAFKQFIQILSFSHSKTSFISYSITAFIL